MQIASLALGIIALVVMFVAFIPCLGWVNWMNIPFAFVGLIIGSVGVGIAKPDEDKGPGIAGIVCNSVAVALGTIRLIIGLGIF
ncbi:MAG: hypothetical protein ABIJ56_05470 [Pseudomonadota bacterium]